MYRRFITSLVVLSMLATLTVFTGCAAYLKTSVLQPAPVNFGKSMQLSVVQSEGKRSAREDIIQEIINVARSDGYFTVTDRTEEGIEVKIIGRTVEITGGETAQAKDEIYVRIDVYDYESDSDNKTESYKDSEGNVKTRTVKVYEGSVELGVTASNAANKAYLAETEYVGEANLTGSGDSEDKALRAATAHAVRRLLNDITPRWVPVAMRLDTKDKGQKDIIKVAKKGNVEQSLKLLRAYLEANPGIMQAQYNIAVMLDAQGEYEEALSYYDKALKGPAPSYYSAGRADCAVRMAAAQALQE